MRYNIYCDESCHLENDKQNVMVLGALSCPTEKRKDIAERIREIKESNGFRRTIELKWTKVSKGGVDLYLDVIDYFFDNDDLKFRGVVIPDKMKLDHGKYNQTHDTWYYKMLFLTLNFLMQSNDSYNVYIDIKDTRSAKKMEKLHDVLCCSNYDFDSNIIRKIQSVRSDEVEQIQLVDLLIGALSYANRYLSDNAGKQSLISRIRDRSGFSLLQSTTLGERKFNILRWKSCNG